MKKAIALLLFLTLVLSITTPATEALSFESSGPIEKTEVLSKRDAYSKTYILPDGSYQYVGYAEPIHFQDSTGTYVEINNRITNTVKQEGYTYTNTSNAWNAYFSEKLSNNNAVTMTTGKYCISFSLLEQTGTATVAKATDISLKNPRESLSTYHQNLSNDDRAVIYSDVIENVDIAYTVQAGVLKEDIIIKGRNTPTTFKFRLTTNGLILKEHGNTLALFSTSGEEVFTFAPLYMEDANGKRSEKVSLTYTSVKNGYELTVSADASFLNAVDTMYPVVIDPSIMVTGANVTYDTCVDQEYPTSNYYLSENLWTGGALGTNAMRTYIKFEMPDGILANQVTSAYIYLLKKQYQAPTIRAYRVTSSWASSSITWNSKPSFSSSYPTEIAVNTVGDWYGLDVTALTKKWLSGTYSNYGVVLKEPYEINSAQKTKFYSSDAPSPNKPELVINYNSDTGTISRTLSDVPTNLRSTSEHLCIPCAITNVAAYWSVNAFSQFGCSTASAQETAARNVQSTMAAAGSHSANKYIPNGFSIFSHNNGTVTYGLRATNCWRSDNAFTFNDIVTEIDAGRPLLLGFAGVADSPFNGGHMTTCAGYKISGSTQYVIISDAHNGYLRQVPFRISTYNDFISKVNIIRK